MTAPNAPSTKRTRRTWLRGAGASLTGRLRTSATVTFARLHVIPRLPKFLAAHPDLRMDVILDDRVIDLVEEGVDVALRMGTLADSSLTVRKLASAPRHVVGTAAYFARSGVPATPGELAEQSVVICVPDSGSGTYTFRQGAAELSVSVSGRLRVSAAEGVRAGIRCPRRHGCDHRFGVDVQSRVRVGRGARGADGLVTAVDRCLRGLPDGPDAKRQGPFVRCLRRGGADSMALPGRAARKLRPPARMARMVRLCSTQLGRRRPFGRSRKRTFSDVTLRREHAHAGPTHRRPELLEAGGPRLAEIWSV